MRVPLLLADILRIASSIVINVHQFTEECNSLYKSLKDKLIYEEKPTTHFFVMYCVRHTGGLALNSDFFSS
jgi:hypothetical protein